MGCYSPPHFPVYLHRQSVKRCILQTFNSPLIQNPLAMLFNSIFGRKNSTSSTSSQAVKLNKKNHQPRSISFEPLESRGLLTVTTGAIDNDAYDEIRAAYPEFNLPELQAD